VNCDCLADSDGEEGENIEMTDNEEEEDDDEDKSLEDFISDDGSSSSLSDEDSSTDDEAEVAWDADFVTCDHCGNRWDGFAQCNCWGDLIYEDEDEEEEATADPQVAAESTTVSQLH